jgi:5-epi-alpha-selinene synthase
MSNLDVAGSQQDISASTLHQPQVIDLFCPFSPGLNPCAVEVQAESLQWAQRIGLLSTDEEVRRLARSKVAYLPARVFWIAPPELLQLAADWTTLFCILDDHVDVMVTTASLMKISDYLSRLLAAFNGVTVRDQPIDRAFFDLGRRMCALAPADWVRRFGGALESLFGGYLWEAINYWRDIKPSIDAYCTMREITIGLHPQFILGELAEGIRLAEATRDHPTLGRLRGVASKCVGWANDIFTYKTEMERGQVHNLVIILADSSSLDQVVRRVAEMHNSEVRSFLDEAASLPSFGNADKEVRRYVNMLQSWIRGHLDWAKDTGRYDPMVMQHVPAQ